MWLLPILSRLSLVAVKAFYRARFEGPPVPSSGPLLLVANHPGALNDPAGVAAAARRPVRFLGKAPLFSNLALGWLVRGAGAIPVYRKQDDPTQTDKNEDAFRAVHQALASGDAIGIFPEGISHNAPSLSPLRTGAARMALGAAALIGHAFPIIPVGLVYRDKDRFRADALFVTGSPIEWSDLEKKSEEDADAVRELTRRIDAALQAVTINLDQWEDAPIVECAEAIYASELGLPQNAADRFERTRQIARSLRKLRTSATEGVDPLYRSVVDYARLMKELHLRPRDLTLAPARFTIAWWVVNKLTFLLTATPLLVVARIVFFVPYEITGRVASNRKYSEDVRATLKLLGGGALHLVWIVAISLAVGEMFGWRFAPLVFVLLALLGFASIFLSDRWYRTFEQARRFLLLSKRESLRSLLLKRRANLARQLEELRLRLAERKQ